MIYTQEQRSVDVQAKQGLMLLWHGIVMQQAGEGSVPLCERSRIALGLGDTMNARVSVKSSLCCTPSEELPGASADTALTMMHYGLCISGPFCILHCRPLPR